MPAIATEYMCTKFGVNSSSCFPFRAQKHTDTHTQGQRCHYRTIPRISYAGV